MRGVYKITQISTGKVYIGQSMNIDNRWHQHALAVDDLSFHREYLKDPTDFAYQTLKENDEYTKDDLDRLEKQYITDLKANDPKYGFNGTAGNGDGKKKTKSTKILTVKKGNIQLLFNLYIENKVNNIKVLIIGVFKTIPEYLILKNCDVTIFTDDYDYTCDEARIVRFDGGDDLMNKVKEIKKGEYDLIIANPPYNIGAKIISQFVTKAENSIVLCPTSCLADYSNYKHVRKVQLADPKAFKDAHVQKNLIIVEMIDVPNENKVVSDVISLTYNEEYREFYKKNGRVDVNKFGIVFVSRPEISALYDEAKLPPVKSFMMPWRTVHDGVHSLEGGAMDLSFNLQNQVGHVPTVYQTHIDAYFLLFKDGIAKKNLCKFWYYNPLMNKLLKGLNASGGKPLGAIPHIDWSKDRDYEHCTLDDIMKWLDEDNK